MNEEFYGTKKVEKFFNIKINSFIFAIYFRGVEIKFYLD